MRLEEVADLWYKFSVEEAEFFFAPKAPFKPWPGLCWSKKSTSYIYNCNIAEPWKRSMNPGDIAANPHGRFVSKYVVPAFTEHELVETYVASILNIMYKLSRIMMSQQDSDLHWVIRNYNLTYKEKEQFLKSSVFVNFLGACAFVFEMNSSDKIMAPEVPPIVFLRRAQLRLKMLNCNAADMLTSSPTSTRCSMEKIHLVSSYWEDDYEKALKKNESRFSQWGSVEPTWSDAPEKTMIMFKHRLESTHNMLCYCPPAFSCTCPVCVEQGCHRCLDSAVKKANAVFLEDLKTAALSGYEAVAACYETRVSREVEEKLLRFEKARSISRQTEDTLHQDKYRILLNCNCIMCSMPKIKFNVLEMLKFHNFRGMRISSRSTLVYLQRVCGELGAEVFSQKSIAGIPLGQLTIQHLHDAQTKQAKEFWTLMCELSSDASVMVYQAVLQMRYFQNLNAQTTQETYGLTCAVTVRGYTGAVANDAVGFLREVSDMLFDSQLRTRLRFRLLAIVNYPSYYPSLRQSHFSRIESSIQSMHEGIDKCLCCRCKHQTLSYTPGRHVEKIACKLACGHMLCVKCVNFAQSMRGPGNTNVDEVLCPSCGVASVRDSMTTF